MFGFIDTPPILPPQASKFAAQYDLLFWYMMAVVSAGGGVVYLLLTYCCFLFAKRDGENRKPARILGSNKLEIIWTVIPLFFFLSFFVWGARLWDTAINPPPEASAREYFVVGKQWMWKVQGPEGHRQINEITLPCPDEGDADPIRVKVSGTSEDVIHDFGIPAFRSKFDVVPGRVTAAWYEPTVPGVYHLFCDQYCGQGHSQMVGKVTVMRKSDYERWLNGEFRRDGRNPVDGSPAWQGRLLFLKLQCNGCHFTQAPDDPAPPKAPTLENLYGTKREMSDGKTFTADENYIRTAIRNPSEHVRSGWKAIMPPFHSGLATDTDIFNLTAFIKSLQPGDLPYRNERSPTPIGGAPPASQGNPNPMNPAPNGGNK
jgi:cytochrome c oxidase subunit 2